MIGSGGVALGLGMSPKAFAGIAGANERVNFGVAGLHGRGRGLLKAIANVSGSHVGYVCDVDSHVREQASESVKELFGSKPQAFTDFRKMLEEKDLDAVVIAAPDHWHAPMAIMAARAGKDVYVEKPCSHNPREGEWLVRLRQETGRVIQMGNQQRSAPTSIQAVMDIRDGIIGDVYFGKAWYSSRRGPIGTGQKVAVPEWLDWGLWQGPAPRRDYQDIWVHYNWHWFRDYGTGEVSNNGLHEIDICRWALGVGHPEKVSSSGGRYHYDDDWEFYDTQVVNYEYPGNKMITWEGKSCNGFAYYDRGRGATIHGTKGTIMLDRNGYQAWDLEGNRIREMKEEGKSETMGIVGGGSLNDYHMNNFVNGIRRGERLHSPIEEGVISTHMCHLGNISQKLGRSLYVDANTGKVLGDGQAMSMWGREYEPGWKPEI